MTEGKYVCAICKKSLEDMPDAILARIVLTPRMREKIESGKGCRPYDDYKLCPCFTGEVVIYHLDIKEVHFLEAYKHSGSWCSAVLLDYLKPVRRKDSVKMVAHLL